MKDLKVKVTLCAFEFAGEKVSERIVTIPKEFVSDNEPALLDHTFYYGQNDFQPSDTKRSVSVGDIINLNGKKFQIDMLGFSEIK